MLHDVAEERLPLKQEEKNERGPAFTSRELGQRFAHDAQEKMRLLSSYSEKVFLDSSSGFSP